MNRVVFALFLLTQDLLTVDDANVISVDYGALVPRTTLPPESGIDYLKAVEAMYLVAEHVALFIDWLTQETSLTTSSIHLIGHSLGAHNAGMTAKNVRSGIIRRITGLDPTGPLFETATPDRRLDSSQADFVDIIHTNACGFLPQTCRGILQAIGHVDFYLNGGMLQPGCDDPVAHMECSHQRSTAVWIESISPTASFTAWPCPNVAAYLTSTTCDSICPDAASDIASTCNSCGEGCLQMGFYLNTRLRGSYFLCTNPNAPYARGDQKCSSIV